MTTLANSLEKYLAHLYMNRKQEYYSDFWESYKEDDKIEILYNYLKICSPFLYRLIEGNKDFFFQILASNNPESVMASLLDEAEDKCINANDEEIVAKEIRKLKQKAILLIALCDIAGIWNLSTVTRNLSKTADTAMDLALSFLVKKDALCEKIKSENQSSFLPKKARDWLDDCGITVIGMGKLGAKELNYSSDIDLILLYDASKVRYEGKYELQEYMVKLAKRFVSLIDSKTRDGYVFRVDLRIRPDPSSTPLIMTASACESYYETFGRNWERAALIKARAAAGDIRLGNDFIARIQPFIWRRSLDFKAISDIRHIKEQILLAGSETQELPSVDKPYGYNIKLGRGGIRDIEFFAQIEQLIWGGHNKSLRESQTCEALKKLKEALLISKVEESELIKAYAFLRKLEHRLQMANDEQTHRLGCDENSILIMALFMGFTDIAAFKKELYSNLNNVSKCFNRLFVDTSCENGKRKTDTKNSVLAKFSILQDEEQGKNYLTSLNFNNTTEILKVIRGWERGIYRSLRSEACKHALPEQVILILEQLSKTDNPTKVFYSFDNLLSRMTYGVELIPLFANKPEIRQIVLDLLCSGDTISDNMQKNPTLIVDLINPDFFLPLPTPAEIAREAKENLSNFTSLEKAIDAITLWVNSKRFQAATHLYKGLTNGIELGKFMSELARTALATLFPYIEKDFARVYGSIDETKVWLLLLGKAGSGEANILSDLDLIFIYDGNSDTYSRDGTKNLEIADYYTRLMRKLITCMGTEGKYGKLWEIDTRLRPSGTSGAVAVQLNSFLKYQKEEAWTWEYMALAKANIIYGDDTLLKQIHSILSRKREQNQIKRDIANMRQRLLQEKPAKNIWDLKNAKGGMTDIEFASAYYQLLFAHENANILQTATIPVLEEVKKMGITNNDTVEFLINSYKIMIQLNALLSLQEKNREKISSAFLELLAKRFGFKSDKELKEHLIQMENKVYEVVNANCFI